MFFRVTCCTFDQVVVLYSGQELQQTRKVDLFHVPLWNVIRGPKTWQMIVTRILEKASHQEQLRHLSNKDLLLNERGRNFRNISICYFIPFLDESIYDIAFHPSKAYIASAEANPFVPKVFMQHNFVLITCFLILTCY